MDRLHGGAAEAVDGRAGDAQRQLGQKADQAGDVEALLTLGKGAADDQILDGRRIDLGALDQGCHDLGGQIVRTHAGQVALAGEMERGPGVARDHDGFHDVGSSSAFSVRR